MILEPSQIKKEIEELVNMDLCNNSREIPFIHYKQMYMKLATMFTARSLKEIGALVNRKYSTVIHARDVFENHLPYSKTLWDTYSSLVAKYSLTEKVIVKNVNLLDGIIFV